MRWKFQYSLSSLLWFTLCLALMISSFLMYRRMEKAEKENLILRREAGYLTVGDERLVHAVNLKTYDPFAWRWRFFVPPKHGFIVKAWCGDIPATGMPKIEGEVMSAEGVAGEMVLNAVLRQNKAGKWEVYLTFRDQKLDDITTGNVERHASIPLPDVSAKIISEKSYGTTSVIFGAEKTDSRSLDQPIVLLRHRFLLNGSGMTEPMPGIIIWLEEKK